MAPRKTPKSHIRIVSGPDLQPGDLVWCYLRHSPGEDQTILSQRRDVERFVADQGLVVARWYIDEARSGSTIENRDEFERMLTDSQQQPPPVKAIVVWDLSRFSRDELESQFYSADFRLRGYEIVSIKDEIPRGEFAGIFEAFIRWKNARYLRDLQMATIRVLDAVVYDKVAVDGVERTGFSAGGFSPRGYVARRVEVGLKPSGKPITRTYWVKTEDPDLRKRVELAWSMAIEAGRRAERPPVNEIHKLTRLFRDNSSCYDMFRTITYTGTRQVGQRTVPNAHEAYVSRKEFDLVQRVMPGGDLAPTRLEPRTVASPFIFSGRIFCGYCGAPVHCSTDPRRGSAWLSCSRRKNNYRSCRLSKLRYETLLDSILATLREDVFTEEYVGRLLEEEWRREDEARSSAIDQRKALERQLVTIRRAIERLLDALEMSDEAETIRERLSQREREKARLEQELTIARRQSAGQTKRIPREYLPALVSDLHAALSTESREELRELLEEMICRIELENDTGRLYFVLPVRVYAGYPVGDSNARTWLRRPALYPLS